MLVRCPNCLSRISLSNVCPECGESIVAVSVEWRLARSEVRKKWGVYWGNFTRRSWIPPITPWRLHWRRIGHVMMNLGCGRDIKLGYINVDQYPYPGAIVGDVEGHLPFKSGTIDLVYASHVMEHVLNFGAAMNEIHRVLRLGGMLEAHVPYKHDNDNPFHLRRFSQRSLWAVLGPGATLEGNPQSWKLLHHGITARGFPQWHIREYLKWNLPIGRPLSMVFILKKVG